MPQSSIVETALVTIAIAVSVQTILVLGLSISAFIAWRRVRTALSTTSADLHARLDEIAGHVKSTTGRVHAAVSSIERIAADADAVAGGARRIAGDVGGVVRAVAQTAMMPQTLLAMAGRLVLSRWPRRRPVYASADARRR